MGDNSKRIRLEPIPHKEIPEGKPCEGKLHARFGLWGKGFPIYRAAFTLIELLMVIAIISILASLLLPALKSAKEEAKKILCLNQLKQIWPAFNSYSDDCSEWICPWRQATATGTYYWTYYIGNDYLMLPMQLGDLPRTILRCPSENMTLSLGSWRLWTPASYAINGATWDYAIDGARLRRNQIRYPSAWGFLMDGKQISYWECEGPPGATYSQDYRHMKSLNVLFLDGHAESYSWARIPKQGTDYFYRGM